MILCNINNSFNYELEKLCRIFLPFEKIKISETLIDNTEAVFAVTNFEAGEINTALSASLNMFGQEATFTDHVQNDEPDYLKECERVLAVQLFNCFVSITGYTPEWGILTGVRPAKLYSRLVNCGGREYADSYFSDKLCVSDEKISLCRETEKGEKNIIALSCENSFSLYVSIPFCPTRCAYCSFVSHSVDKAQKLIPVYIEKLVLEIAETAQYACRNGLKLETVYIGGGTPTSLTHSELNTVMKAISDHFDLTDLREYTVEAGRPDTITPEKLDVIMKNGATRISINPQTMNDAVLGNIGRRHTSTQTIEAYSLARKMGFNNINMDLIAGLPGDTVESFSETVDKIIALNPESVTVHSLSVKRAANLSQSGTSPRFDSGNAASSMVRYARRRLTENGILPYYMYRQSKTVGNLENVGYSKLGFEGLYNVYIMDETHTILACGASAVTKLRRYNDNYIERVFNYKYPYEYINGFDEILSRKARINDFYDKHPVGNK